MDQILLKLQELKDDNAQAMRYMEEDREAIRFILYHSLHSFKCLLLPGVSEKALEAKRHDWRYSLAAHFLMGDQMIFQILLTVTEIFMSMFFPPIGFAIGAYNAYLQIDEAVFKGAISDANLNVDDAYISQEQARTAAIWAGVAAGFVALDGLGSALRLTRRFRPPLDEIDDIVDEVGSNAALALSHGGTTVDRIADIADMSQHMDLLQRNLTSPHQRWFSQVLNRPDIINEMRALDIFRNAKGKIWVLSEYRRYYRSMMERLNRLPAAERGAHLHPMTIDEFASSWVNRRAFLNGRKRLDKLAAIARESDALAPFEILRRKSGKSSLRELFEDIPSLRNNLRRHINELQEGAEELETFRRILDDLENNAGPFRDYARRFQFLEDNLPPLLRDSPDLIDDLARIESVHTWMRGTAEIAEESREAFQAAARLMRNSEIDPRLVAHLLNNVNIKPNARRWAIILDRIQGAEGFINRVAESNPSLLDSMVNGNRGHAFEALISSRVNLQYIESISLGNRFPISGGRMVEADLLVTFRDGKNLLVDAKFWPPGHPRQVHMVRHAEAQLTKMHEAIMNPQIDVDAAEFWISHGAETTMRRRLATLAGSGDEAAEAARKIHIVTDVIAYDWTEWFLRTDVPLTWTDFELPLLGAAGTTP